uniref:PPM-type phosphatase domain-containing protein n=2 Tax=Hemiselmis andersenii TaxID=464988 RepID=A0A6U4VMZ7_HEMAN
MVVEGWAQLSDKTRADLRHPKNEGFPLALQEAKRHIHKGIVDIPMVMRDGGPIQYGRPESWAPGLARLVMDEILQVKPLRVRITDDTLGPDAAVLLPDGSVDGHFGGYDSVLGCAYSSIRGGCSYQEDRCVLFRDLFSDPSLSPAQRLEPGISFFGVYDGHLGSQTSEYLVSHLHANFAAELRHKKGRTPGDLKAAVRAAFKRTDEAFWEEWVKEGNKQNPKHNSGSAAVVVVIRGRDMVVGHVGDCRVVLSRAGGDVVELTVDHTFENEREVERVKAAGGKWVSDRLDGILQVSRAFGDFEEGGKPLGLTADPDIVAREIEDEDEFLVISSDGLWDKENTHMGLVSGKASIDFVRKRLATNQNDLQKAVEEVTAEGVKCSESDNTTAILVSFRSIDQVEPPSPVPERLFRIHTERPRFINVPKSTAPS